jgi:glucokinase
MKSITNDKRLVLTLDAGGTNFVFSAIKGGREIIEPIVSPSFGDNLTNCLKSITNGFTEVKNQLKESPVAISFAFPGPADYPNGIIGDLGNLPAFRGGIALGPMLEEMFKIPVFINNDGDLFTYGEAIDGFLPEINLELESKGISKRYKNLLGVTLGTGFGAGIVYNGQLYMGDNSAGAEIWVTRNAYEPKVFAEESISIRAVQREYAKITGNKDDIELSPKEIFDIAYGYKKGNAEAAKSSFEKLGTVLGDVLANAITLLDCNVVIGGGLSNAYPLFAPAMMKQLNGNISTFNNDIINRLEVKCYNMECNNDKLAFFQSNPKRVTIPNTTRGVTYNWQKQVAIGRTRLGTSKAVAIGAYAFALNNIDRAIK